MATMFLKQAFAATVLALAAFAPQAAVLYSQAPVDGFDGIQADGGSPPAPLSTGPYRQNFIVAAGAVLESIEWYGYHLPGGSGASADLFAVLINGVDVFPTSLSFNKEADGNPVEFNGFEFARYKYTLDVVDIDLMSGTLDLANGPDTQWAWQLSDFQNEFSPATAFTLNGTVNAVPEPQTAALILLGLAAMAGISRHNRRA